MAVEDQPDVVGRVQSVDRAIALLDALAALPGPESAQVLADRCGLNRTTAWRLLSTLEHHGLVDREPDTNRYHLGLGILRLAGAASYEPLVRRAHPRLRQLAERTGEIVNLAVARGHELIYADQVQAGHVIELNWIGHPAPLHATSTGKAFLAALNKRELQQLLVAPLDRFTDRTITDLDQLEKDLAQVRMRGYAESRGEYDPILWGVSAVVRNSNASPVAVVSVHGVERRTKHRLEALGTACLMTAEDLTESLVTPYNDRE